MGAPQRRSPDRRRDRANSDAERRALAKASGRRTGPAARAPRPGYAVPSTDDGSRRNPGPAAIGYVLAVAEGTLLAAHGEAIGSRGRTSPSTALCWPPSYTPAGSAWAGAARCDARLVVEQVTGGREPANPRLRELCIAVREAAQRIGTVVFAWVPAEADRRAHALVAKALAISTATGDTAERRRDDRTKGRTPRRRTRGEPVTAA